MRTQQLVKFEGIMSKGNGKYVTEESLKSQELAGFRKVFSKVIVGRGDSDQFLFVVLTIEPGGAVTKHSHVEESCYYFIEGSGRVFLGDDTHSAVPGAAVYIPAWQTHGIENNGEETLKYIEVKSPVPPPG